ncbi:PrsW family intramembrane metalloprotease [Deinococcus peraridilitoris]|uniref:Protease PrsW n=1 Tax=Deinococcus peraridilitoris (strain DSM 19664 / LMG 22246 / CIP 109416 / KR-200) TaxID=937777 RepID=L0A104_DEIPD|nr:PrsW family glutamic-type intramembrane protease [Deinococcus peraridilitoris]AFZ66680.1 putative membrane protein [Deinococcus peraridilitoris DSM 19664]
MEVVVLLGLTVLPTVFWLWFFVRRDAHPEPPRLLLRTFAYGGLAWLLSALLELSVRGVPGPVVTLLLIALIEEATKLLAASTAAREREFDEPMDGLIYAVTAALGFALFENLAYAVQFGIEVALLRALLTALAHALFSAPLGYGLARVRFGGGRWWRTRGLLASATLHVVFNGLLSGAANWWQLPVLGLTLLAMYVLAHTLYVSGRKRQESGLDRI